VALFLIEHFKFKPRVIFYPRLVITIVIAVALSVLVIILIAAALIALGWDDDPAVLEARVPFEFVELDRVEVVECVFPRSALEYATISNKMK
jgi:hypothetical protein